MTVSLMWDKQELYQYPDTDYFLLVLLKFRICFLQFRCHVGLILHYDTISLGFKGSYWRIKKMATGRIVLPWINTILKKITTETARKIMVGYVHIFSCL